MFKKKQIVQEEKVDVDEYLAYMAIVDDQLKIFLNNLYTLINNNDNVKSIWGNIFFISLTNINEQATLDALVDSLNISTEDIDVSIKLNNLHLLMGTTVPRFMIKIFKKNFYSTMLEDFKIQKTILDAITDTYQFIYLLPRLSFICLNDPNNPFL